MLKRIFIGLAILFGLIVPVHAAGTISLSLSQQFDQYGKPLSGCKLFFIQAGTTATPQNAYQDSGLNNALPNPLECDAAGRLPQFYLADGQIKIRLTDKNGVTQVAADNLLVIGPSSGGGGGGGDVDPTTIFETGSLKAKYGTGSLSGWVRLNGRTIGSATSGATERANADCQALFEYLWAADANLAVSGGRGASAAADWAANKTITLPDAAGRVFAGLDDMGAGARGRLTSDYFGTATNVLGAASSSQSFTLLTANLPPYTPAGTITNGSITYGGWVGSGTSSAPPNPGNAFPTTLTFVSTLSQAASTFAGTAQGGTSTPFSVIQPTILVTIYMKL
jgi:hypothetical protein